MYSSLIHFLEMLHFVFGAQQQQDWRVQGRHFRRLEFTFNPANQFHTSKPSYTGMTKRTLLPSRHLTQKQLQPAPPTLTDAQGVEPRGIEPEWGRKDGRSTGGTR